jgi:hypothetical protein
MVTFYFIIWGIVDLGDNLDDTLDPNQMLDVDNWLW